MYFYAHVWNQIGGKNETSDRYHHGNILLYRLVNF